MDMSEIWASLIEDADLPLWVVDGSGRVEFASRAAIDELADGRRVVGQSLSDLLPPGMGQERLMLIARVAATGRPILMVEMIRGRWARTVMRRISGAPSIKVLITSRLGWNASDAPRPDEIANYEIVEPKLHDAGELGPLTECEVEVLALIGEGLSTAEIAVRLGRTPKTVEWHRCSLGKKLHVSSKIELAKLADRAGLRSATATRGQSPAGMPWRNLGTSDRRLA
jgi:DNA-binding NarL/FixJ family response regulator